MLTSFPRKRAALSALLLAIALVGCGGGNRGLTPEEVEINPTDSSEGVVGDTADTEAVTATGLGSDGSVSGSGDTSGSSNTAADSDAALLAQRVIYFEYDSSALTAESEAIVRAHAQRLQGGDAQVVLEGHADERGTREYNLALAEDRAKATANLMQALGIDADRIQSVSYGEERPIALGHDETAWHLNRRVEILY